MNTSRGMSVITGLAVTLVVLIALIGGGYVALQQGIGQSSDVYVETHLEPAEPNDAPISDAPLPSTLTTVKETPIPNPTQSVSNPNNVILTGDYSYFDSAGFATFRAVKGPDGKLATITWGKEADGRMLPSDKDIQAAFAHAQPVTHSCTQVRTVTVELSDVERIGPVGSATAWRATFVRFVSLGDFQDSCERRLPNTNPNGPVMSVKKVPAGTMLDISSTEKSMELTYTVAARPEPSAVFSVCYTLIEPSGRAVSETDCTALGAYGTVTTTVSGDLSLAPLPGATEYWKPGHHPTKLRFDLVDKRRLPPEGKDIVLGADDTGVFDYYFPNQAE